MSSYTDPSFVTSGDKLKSILSKCKTCYKLTLKGSLILPIESLGQVVLPKIHQKKFFIIIHLKSTDEQIGHWIAAACYLSQRRCVIIDPSNKYRHSETCVQKITQFCKTHNLTELNYATQFQGSKSFACGQLVLAMCAKMHSHTLKQFLDLRKLIRSFTISFNEHQMVLTMKRHFDTSIY